jgi:hypothetical protein
MNKTQLKKLEALVKHNETNRQHTEFCFSHFHSDDEENVCGTSGCVAGELPHCFPAEWRWKNNGGSLYPYLIKGTCWGTTRNDIAKFFGLTLSAAGHLFYPRHQRPKLFGGADLGPTAELHEVLRNFKIFIRRHKAKSKLKAKAARA